MLEQIKQRQYLVLLLIIVGLSVALVVVAVLWCGSMRQRPLVATHKRLITGVDRINQQELWVHDFTTKAKLTEQRLKVVEELLQKLLVLNQPATAAVATPSVAPPVTELKQELANVRQAAVIKQLPQLEAEPQVVTNTSFKPTGLKKISFNLQPHQGASKTLTTTDNTVPAGSFAAARLLGGVDASTSIQAASDPRPVLLRLVEHGTLPRAFKSDLQGCHILAAAYGDLSSERVYMRLEKLGCVERKTGETIEFKVQGFIAGEDGRVGVRGSVVDKASPALRDAMVGGFFSSIGRFLGQARTPVVFSPTTGLAQNDPLTAEQIFKQSAANGMSGALDKYADFYIKRAEQMQPVIQVAAGRRVDVVFTEGFNFADSKVRQVFSKANDQHRWQQVQAVAEHKPVTAWLNEEKK